MAAPALELRQGVGGPLQGLVDAATQVTHQSPRRGEACVEEPSPAFVGARAARVQEARVVQDAPAGGRGADPDRMGAQQVGLELWGPECSVLAVISTPDFKFQSRNELLCGIITARNTLLRLGRAALELALP